MEREPPRRRIGDGALIDEAALDERIGDELPQILRGAALHARGDFLGEQFEQEIGHGGALSRPGRQRGEARRTPLPRGEVDSRSGRVRDYGLSGEDAPLTRSR